MEVSSYQLHRGLFKEHIDKDGFPKAVHRVPYQMILRKPEVME